MGHGPLVQRVDKRPVLLAPLGTCDVSSIDVQGRRGGGRLEKVKTQVRWEKEGEEHLILAFPPHVPLSLHTTPTCTRANKPSRSQSQCRPKASSLL